MLARTRFANIPTYLFYRWVNMKKISRFTPLTLIWGLILSGCSGIGRPLPYGLLTVEYDRPITIPAGRAHTKFQFGRQVSGVDRYEPWCELEIRTVSEEPQRIEPDSLVVAKVNQSFIKDYNTRISAVLGGLSCDDLVFKETTWWMEPETGSPVMYLRCLAPYTNCRFGPPLSVEQIRGVVGPKLDIAVNPIDLKARARGAGSSHPDRNDSFQLPESVP